MDISVQDIYAPKPTPAHSHDILRGLLQRLPAYLDNAWQDLPDETGYFGDGTSGENGIRTNSNLVYAIAVFITTFDREGEKSLIQIQMKNRLRRLVRYLIQSHRIMNGRSATGGQWGLEWQSSWWATKLALGAQLAKKHLDPKDLKAVHVLIAAEADRHLDRMVPTGLAHDTKAEETAWDAEALATALALLPEHPQAALWNNRLRAFALNTFSCPSDRTSPVTVDGLRVRDVIRSCNIHEDGTLENHGSAHFCYIASPLLSKTWCAHALRQAGQRVPKALFHNIDRVWAFAEPTFLENRFAYIGGQDWARYTYGEYFIVPTLIFLHQEGLSDQAADIFRRRLLCLANEAEQNTDGSFFGARFTTGRYSGQFAKYETDCFACVSLALELSKKTTIDEEHPAPRPAPTVRVSHEALCCYARNDLRFASFSWSTLTEPVPNITFVPLADDSLGEWHAGNLIGKIKFLERTEWVGVKAMEETQDGFVVEGSHSLRNDKGWILAEHRLRLELKTDTMRVRSVYTARRKLKAVLATGLNWRIPNDIFNGFVRHYHTGDRSWQSEPISRKMAPHNLRQKVLRKIGLNGTSESCGPSRWVNVDDQVGLIDLSNTSLYVRSYPERASTWNSLYVEQVEAPNTRWYFNLKSGQTILDTDVIMHVGTHLQTRALAETSM